ncbi:hypothetical protein FNF29_00345 [Cafeteria roenbergensis]|uniref:Transmembrane protein n=1 Tax=Cafeteria roenbergensis TaxID=33653 RepID=A0A5A8D194_CAFRO|nr:hypothetical protein FNF29_00345 [Cafeteria roenbergensis]|eukprot:KAA0157771.1 hypothetical protein FNF29_00345 [Cafeteria roenbergensis]
MLVSWFWNASALIAIAISSAVDLLRNLGYCWQARAGLSGPGGLPPSVFVTWTVSILLHFAAIGCSSYVMNVVENLDDVTREEAELFEPLFWAGCICSIVGPLASVSVALSAAGDVKPQVVADFARRTPGEGATDTRPLLNVATAKSEGRRRHSPHGLRFLGKTAMATASGTPVPQNSQLQPAPTVWESEGCTDACKVMSQLGVGANMRLCCRPWTRDERVVAGLEVFRAESAIDALYGVIAMLVAYFWAFTVLIAVAIVSVVGLMRSVGYFRQARAGLNEPGGLSPSVFTTWAAGMVLQAGAFGCVSFVLDVMLNLDSITLDEAQLVLPLFWVGSIGTILGHLASALVAHDIMKRLAPEPEDGRVVEMAGERSRA